MGFEFFVAMRYLKAKRRQAAVSVVTAISILGVLAGVSALVIALAINNGFREELERRLLGATANINLLRVANDGIKNYDELTSRLSRVEHVVAAAPVLYEEVLVSSHSRAQGIVLKGVDTQREVQVGDLLKRLREGTLSGLAESTPDSDPIIIGKVLARSLGVFVGDTVLVTSPQGYLTPLEIVPKFRHFRVVGVFDSGFYDFDATWAFTNLGAAQRLFDLANVVSVIEFKIDDIYQAPQVASALEKAAGPGFTTTTWMEQNRSLFSALRLERLVTILTIGLIVCVAALNIFIALAMMVMEKNRDIAVLMSMGAKKRQIWAVFTLYGVLIGSVGTLLGLCLGYITSWVGDRYRLIPLQADIYALSSVPFHARLPDGLWIAAAALTISFIATLYPSLAAARLNPVEILRYE
ncbi:MAG TPA: ABC transporter permease [Terriglobia bacterium]|jgi:lipoprotein-releasing system permease protein|nr:ABC transporter permease [Terriglobia bacterium]